MTYTCDNKKHLFTTYRYNNYVIVWISEVVLTFCRYLRTAHQNFKYLSIYKT